MRGVQPDDLKVSSLVCGDHFLVVSAQPTVASNGEQNHRVPTEKLLPERLPEDPMHEFIAEHTATTFFST